MATSFRFTLAIAAVAAFTAVPASAQEVERLAPGAAQLAQSVAQSAIDQAAGEELDDAALLGQVLAALAPGVTLETATDEQIFAAIQSVIASYGVGAPAADVGQVATRVLSVVTISLDSIGRSGSASSVTNTVMATLPPASRSQVQQQVASARSNPTPSQVAATALVISQIQPAAGQQQQQQQVILPVVQPGQESLGQSVFQENPNQVSPS